METLVCSLILCYTAFSPPPIYRTWWDEAQECYGVESRTSYNDVHWYIYRKSRIPCSALAGCNGTAGWGKEVNVVLAAPYVLNQNTVKHEMLHLISRRGNEIHDEEKFRVCATQSTNKD